MIESNMMILLGLVVAAAALLGAFTGVDLVRRWLKKRQSTPLKARKGPLEARSPQDGTIPRSPTYKHLWRFKESGIRIVNDDFYKFECETCKQTRYILKSYFWNGPPSNKKTPWEVDEEWMLMANPPLNDYYTTTHRIHVTKETEALTEALEAIRFTQEYAQLPCIDGWSWWDFYKKYRPDDAKRLKNEWEAFSRASAAPGGVLLMNEPC